MWGEYFYLTYPNTRIIQTTRGPVSYMGGITVLVLGFETSKCNHTWLEEINMYLNPSLIWRYLTILEFSVYNKLNQSENASLLKSYVWNKIIQHMSIRTDPPPFCSGHCTSLRRGQFGGHGGGSLPAGCNTSPCPSVAAVGHGCVYKGKGVDFLEQFIKKGVELG